MTEGTQLKRLGFVQGYASQGYQTLEGVYKTTRSFVPGFVEPYAKQAEETAVSIAAPYFTMAQDTADKLLAGVDGQVDKSLQTLSGALDYSKDLHEKNMTTFNGAKDQYFGFVEATVDRIKALLDPSPYIQWASGRVGYYVDPDKLVDTSVEYAGKVASFGPVPMVVDIADPLIKTSVKTYGSVHDTLVAMPLYKVAWDLVWSTSGTLQESWPAKKFTELAYPLLAPLADPVVTNVSNSKYLKQLETHLRPL
eukprot:GHRQ01002999.1.p1 GENE.GHRQ01002999.1~~GHRQ01002999.1.p1  ORF type:complete len:252 (+),score=82.87 GHRQ01002999.1:143-898(+)